MQAILVWLAACIEPGSPEILFGGPHEVVPYKIKIDKQVIL
jgi:hypothetical protein